MAPVKISAGGGAEGSKESKVQLLAQAAELAALRRKVRALAANEDESAAASLFADNDLESFASSRKLPGDPKPGTEKNQFKGDVKLESELSMMFGNSGTSSLNRQYSSLGFSKTVSTLMKRPYYGAGLDLNNLLPDSFTLDFAVAAFLLANATYDFSSSMNFINTWGAWILPVNMGLRWQVLSLFRLLFPEQLCVCLRCTRVTGNYVLDSAMMGASLSYNLYFTESTSTSDIESISENERLKDVTFLVKRIDNQAGKTSTTSTNGQTVTYASTSTYRVGEFSTQDKQTNALLFDDCRIGQSIIPQVIGFNLRPLWDSAIPYEYFMSQNLSNNFREYLFNSTNTFLDMANNCLDAAGQNCTANNGTCVTVRT